MYVNMIKYLEGIFSAADAAGVILKNGRQNQTTFGALSLRDGKGYAGQREQKNKNNNRDEPEGRCG